MLHPSTQYTLATERIAEEHRRADLERLVRRERSEHMASRVDAATVRQRFGRMLARARRTVPSLPVTGIVVLAVALTPAVVGAAEPPAGPTVQQRQAFLLEEHGYSTGIARNPTVQQRQAFLLEEHGYSTGIARNPTVQQRQAFLLEEHGYSTGIARTPTVQQRQAFLLEEHGYSTSGPALAQGSSR